LKIKLWTNIGQPYKE